MLTPVASGVLVHRSDLLRNNTVVVEGRAGVLLVDPGVTGDELTCLADDLRRLGLPVALGFATHPDWDHALWHPALGDVPRLGTAGCAAYLRRLRSQPDWEEAFTAGLPPEIADETPPELFGLLTGLPEGTHRLPWDGPPVRVLEHPAHAPGHAALLVEEARVLVAGDMLSDLFVPMLGDDGDPVEDYLEGLRVLEGVVADADVVVPGHGSVGTGPQVRARLERDRSYVEALRDGRDVVGDPRVDGPAEPGWEWLADLHEGQVQAVAARPPAGRPRGPDAGSGPGVRGRTGAVGGTGDTGDRGAVDPETVLGWARGLPGARVQTVEEGSDAPPSAWGDSFITYDPDGTADQSRWQPFATVVTSDYPGFDTASRLDRPGVFRVNVSAGRELFAQVLGHPPAEAEQHRGAVDHAATDVWLPHPVYAAQGWVCVVSPGRATAERLRALLEQAHARAAARHRGR